MALGPALWRQRPTHQVPSQPGEGGGEGPDEESFQMQSSQLQAQPYYLLERWVFFLTKIRSLQLMSLYGLG